MRWVAGLPPFSAVVLLAAVAAAAPAPPAPAPAPASASPPATPDQTRPFRVDVPAPGELDVSAKGARLADVLTAMGERADFDVVMNRTVERPPVDATIEGASTEAAVRRVLRSRNYALVYRGGRLSRVIVLTPPDRRKAQQQPKAVLATQRLKAPGSQLRASQVPSVGTLATVRGTAR
ncbi:MAG TPA: hypothetical protein VFD92_02810 [Candidatus Binatia bacterium]|nr:hypothetical protein [Candidatus Binatia bacterium]